jgi:hypothetical protein
MRSAFAASVRFLAEFLWFAAKVILWLIAFVVFMFLLAFLFGPLLDATGPDEYWSDIGAGLFAVAFGVVVFLLMRWVSGKMVRIKWGGPESEAHKSELRHTVQDELSRHRRK